MYSTEMILVHIPSALKSAGKSRDELKKEELIRLVEDYAAGVVDSFCGTDIHSYELMSEEIDHDYPEPVVFADEDWDAFTSYLDECDQGQKLQASHLLEFLRDNTGTTDVGEILDTLLLSHDRGASAGEMDERVWNMDYLDQGAWALRMIAQFIKGTFMFESGFYDSFRKTALIPFYEKLKNKKADWALVIFWCFG